MSRGARQRRITMARAREKVRASWPDNGWNVNEDPEVTRAARDAEEWVPVHLRPWPVGDKR